MSKDLNTIEVEGEHIAWKNELNAVIEQLKQFEATLAEKSSSQNNKKIEHFQNQFLIQKNAINKLKNEITKHDMALERKKKEPFESIENKELEYHENISEQIDIEFKIIKELKEEFEAFLAS